MSHEWETIEFQGSNRLQCTKCGLMPAAPEAMALPCSDEIPQKPPMKKLTKPEFDMWLRQYPRELERDVFGAAEPPFVTWNDFTIAPQWPQSIVASTVAESGEYFVRSDL